MSLSKETKPDTVPEELRDTLLSWFPLPKGERAVLMGKTAFGLKPFLSRVYSEVLFADAFGKIPGEASLIVLTELPETFPERAEDVLTGAREALTEDGMLFALFRNRFGARYFCGGTDETVALPFSGIRGDAEGGKLYSEAEARRLLSRAGFAKVFAYYPLPDPRFVQAVWSEEHLPNGLIGSRVMFYDQNDSPLVASLAALADEMADNGMFSQTADCLLFACVRNGNAFPEAHPVFAALSADRGSAHRFATVLYADGTARKIPLAPEGSDTLREAVKNAERLSERGIPTVPQTFEGGGIRMPLIREPSAMEELRRRFREAPETVWPFFGQLWEDILRSSGTASLTEEEAACWGALPEKLQPVLETGLIDLIPLNAFWKDGRSVYYDQEFAVPKCPARYILFRAVHYVWMLIPEAEERFPLEEVRERLGLKELWKGFWEREVRFVCETRQADCFGTIFEASRCDPEMLRRHAGRLLAPEREPVPDLASIHRVQRGLLAEFDRICSLHGLRYVLMFGTLLGAVRHEGFIPWDDDTDVAMPREDYDRFLALAPGELPAHYFLQTPESDPYQFAGGYAKLRDTRTSAEEWYHAGRNGRSGIWLDILPLDECPADDAGLDRLQRRITRIQRVLLARCYPLRTGKLDGAGGLRVSAYYALARITDRGHLLKRLYRLFSSCRGRGTGRVSVLALCYDGRKNRNVFPAADLSETVMLPFEGLMLPVPAAWDSWLTARYGADYRLLPAGEKRHGHSGVRFETDPLVTERGV